MFFFKSNRLLKRFLFSIRRVTSLRYATSAGAPPEHVATKQSNDRQQVKCAPPRKVQLETINSANGNVKEYQLINQF